MMGKKILLYLQLMALGLMLLLSPCSMRNAIEDSLNLERTTVSNKSKTTNTFEADCINSLVENTGEHSTRIIQKTPTIPPFLATSVFSFHDGFSRDGEYLTISQYEKSYAAKSKTPLYLLYKQLKTHLPPWFKH